MKVYILQADSDQYQDLVPVRDDDWDQFNRLNGSRLGTDWAPVPVAVIEDELNKGKPMGDFPALAEYAPVFSARAVAALGGLLSANGEILPLLSAAGELFAFNVTQVADVLDESRSEIKRMRSGRVLDIIRYEFKPDALEGLVVFKLPQTPASQVYVTDPFVARVKETGLTGMNFKQVWGSNA